MIGNEAKVGAFVLAAIVALAGFALALGDVSWTPRLKVYVDFAHAGSLQVGAPVRLGGLRVGRVASLAVLPPRRAGPADTGPGNHLDTPLVRAGLQLDQQVRPLMTENVSVYVGMQGMIGEAYVDVIPGRTPAAPLADDAVVRGVDAPRWHVLESQVAQVLEVIDGWIGQGAAPGEGGQRSPAGQLLTTLADLLSGNRDEITRTIRLLSASAADLRETLAAVRRVVGDGSQLASLSRDASVAAQALGTDLPPLLARGRVAVETIGQLAERANRTMTNDAAAALVSDVQRAATDLAHAAADARAVATMVREGKGTIGGLVADPQVLVDLRDLLKDLKSHPWKLLLRE